MPEERRHPLPGCDRTGDTLKERPMHDAPHHTPRRQERDPPVPTRQREDEPWRACGITPTMN